MAVRLLAPLAALLGLLPLAPTANATHVQCGDVITQNTRLDSDVVCTEIESNGVVIGADNITLDLRGYSIVGPGASQEDASNGIITDVPRTGLVVKNGTVGGFSQGIDMRFTPGSAASNSVFRDLLLRGAIAIAVSGDHNRFIGNDVYGGFAAMRLDGNNLVVKHNLAGGGDLDVITVNGNQPTIVDNEVVCGPNAALGLTVDGGSGGLVARNSVTNRCNEIGIWIRSPGVVVRGNFGEGASYGIYAEEGVIDGGHNRGVGGETNCVNIDCD